MAVLTQEQYRALRTRVIGVADVELVARKIISPVNVEVGTQQYGYDKMTDMSAAEIISKYAPGSKDMIDLTRKTKNVPILHKGFRVSRIDLMSSERSGESLRAIGLARATRKVAVLEDTTIINGNATFNIDGIETIFGNTIAGTLNWGSGTPTDAVNAYTDVLNLKSLLEADGFKLKFIAMNPTNYGEAGKKITGASGTWLEMIEKIVPTVLQSTAVTEGAFYGGDMGEDIAELVIAENFQLLDPNNKDQMVYDFDVIDRVVPMFYEYGSVSNKSDAFGKVTGI